MGFPVLRTLANTLSDGAKGVDGPFLVITGPPDQRLGRPDSLLRVRVQRR